jgi:hypothetical protein
MPLAAFTFADATLTVVELAFMFLWIWIAIGVVFDIFRSHDLSNWSKALWVLGIFMFPLWHWAFTSLVPDSRRSGTTRRSRNLKKRAPEPPRGASPTSPWRRVARYRCSISGSHKRRSTRSGHSGPNPQCGRHRVEPADGGPSSQRDQRLITASTGLLRSAWPRRRSGLGPRGQAGETTTCFTSAM